MFSPENDDPGPKKYDTPLINVSISGIYLWIKNRITKERIEDDDFSAGVSGITESDKDDK